MSGSAVEHSPTHRGQATTYVTGLCNTNPQRGATEIPHRWLGGHSGTEPPFCSASLPLRMSASSLNTAAVAANYFHTCYLLAMYSSPMHDNILHVHFSHQP